VLPVAALVRSIAEARQKDGVRLDIAAGPEDTAPGSPEPRMPARAEIVHGLGNLVDNAMHFARSRVELRIRWDDSQILLEILDDGPGFEPGVLNLLGEPYLTRRKDEGGMGLGVFIAKTLLNRTGAALGFSNRRSGGAYVTVSWRRKAVEAPATDGLGRTLAPGPRARSEA
jgi:two-component system sensor histidine kinase RegB